MLGRKLSGITILSPRPLKAINHGLVERASSPIQGQKYKDC